MQDAKARRGADGAASGAGSTDPVEVELAKHPVPPARTALRLAPDASGAAASRAQSIVDAMRQAVMEHRLPPGTRLPEDQIGALFGVSRTLVRAALQSLAHDGIVTLAKNRGAHVASPSVAEARHLFEARGVVEAVLVRKAALAMAPSHHQTLAALVRKGHLALKAADRGAAIRLSGEFHLAIAAVAGQPTLETFLSELVSRTSLVIALYGRGGTLDCGEAEHRLLLRALDERDADRAEHLMRAHLGHIERDLDLSGQGKSLTTLADAFRAPVAPAGIEAVTR